MMSLRDAAVALLSNAASTHATAILLRVNCAQSASAAAGDKTLAPHSAAESEARDDEHTDAGVD